MHMHLASVLLGCLLIQKEVPSKLRLIKLLNLAHRMDDVRFDGFPPPHGSMRADVIRSTDRSITADAMPHAASKPYRG